MCIRDSPRTIDFAKFRAIADEVDAKLFVDMAHIAGLVAAGLHPTPIGHAHVTTTTTHKTLRGPRGGMILSDESFGKTLNSQIFPGIQGGPLMHLSLIHIWHHQRWPDVAHERRRF